ncbi:unnamed protein product [Ectocarpus sp. 12 AP-2014]
MHIVAISVGAVHIWFFFLVLRDVLWNNPLTVLRESPAILAASTWLEKSRGNITAHCVKSALPCVGIVLALDDYTFSAMRVVALQGEPWSLLHPCCNLDMREVPHTRHRQLFSATARRAQ